MSLELRVLRGARAGLRTAFDRSAVTIGRHPMSDFRMDAEQDLDVSGRHAEISANDGKFVVRDLGSTNGTYVNGARILDDHVLNDGDVISLGAHGPRIEVHTGGDSGLAVVTGPASGVSAAAAGPGRVTERINEAVRQQTSSLRKTLIAVSLVLLVGMGVAFWVGGIPARKLRAEVERKNAEMDSLIRRGTALSTAERPSVVAALGAARQTADQASARGVDSQQVRVLRHRVAELEALVNSASSDPVARRRAVIERNEGAVVLIAVRWPDGNAFSGTGFAVTADGKIVTNRHNVTRGPGESPKDLLVQYSNTRTWLPARVVKTSTEGDLALIEVVEPGGPYPAVEGIAGTAPDLTAPVVVIGYPLGRTTAQNRDMATATTNTGVISKVLADKLQIDVHVDEGSSGSPVFDERTRLVLGVIYGDEKESTTGRIAYAVSGSLLREFLRPLLSAEALAVLR